MIFKWIKKNKFEVLLVLLILAIALFLRLYRVSGYMTFLGDEGRDALMVKRILVDHDFPLLGPPTSVGNVYLGPLYYYMMAGAMTVFWLNPVAAAGMVAAIGVLAVALVYYLAKEWFGKIPAFLTAFLYAVSTVNIINTHSSWNPSPTPFFALLAILGLHLARKYNNYLFLILTGVSLAAAVQMHYLAGILLPIFVVFWIYEMFTKNKRHFLKGTFGAIIAFITLLSPLIIFDLRYNFLNFNAIVKLFTDKNTNQSFDGFSALSSIITNYKDKLMGRYIAVGNGWLVIVSSIIVSVPLAVTFQRWLLDKKIGWPYFILSIWLVLGIFSVSFYQGPVFDHYLSFVSPAVFLLLAAFVALFKTKFKIIFTIFLLLAVGFFNLVKNPLLSPPHHQLQRTQSVAKFIIEKSGGRPFNFALIADKNYDSAYQFYLDIYGHKPKVVPVEITDQLFVVCEISLCQPTVNPKYEIAAFGMSKVEKEMEHWGLKIYKLVANPSGK